jgi:hypothetical protein
LRSAFLRPLESKPPDHGVFAEAGTNAVNRMLDLDWPVVDEIAGIGMIRRCEPTYADAEEAEFGAVGFAFEKAACGGENLGGELRRRTERMRAGTKPEISGFKFQRDGRTGPSVRPQGPILPEDAAPNSQ